MSVDMHVQFDHHSKISEVNFGKTLLFLMYVEIRAALGLASLPGLRILQHALTQADLDRESLACRNRNFLRRSSKSKPAKKGFEWCNNFRSKPFKAFSSNMKR